MVENAARMGERMLAGLRGLSADRVHEVRGRGLMMAVELHPEAGGARRWCEALRRAGLLCKDTHGHTIRISPPLVITADQADWALERITRTLAGSTPT
jgi:ornithine--oxo-acid transaminase